MWHPSIRWILFTIVISTFGPTYSNARPSKHYYQTADDAVHVDHSGSGHFALTGTSVGVRFPEACPNVAFTLCYKTTYNFPRSLLCPTGFATMHVHSEGSTIAVNNEIVDTITIKNNQNYISNNKLITAPFEYEIDSSLEISFVNLHCAIELTGVTIMRNPDDITESAADGKKDLNDSYNGSIAIYVIVAVFFGLLILVAIALSIWFCKFDPPVKKQKKDKKEEKEKPKSKSKSKSDSKSKSKTKSKSKKVFGTKSKSAKEGDKKSDSPVPDKSKKSEKAIVSETSEKSSKSTTSKKSRPKYVAPTIPTHSNSKSASKQTVIVPAQNPKTPPALLEPSDVVELMDETQKSSKKSKSKKKSTSKPSKDVKKIPKAFIVVNSKDKTQSVDSACCTIPSGSAVKTPSPVDTTTILSEKLQQEEKLIEKSNRMVKTIRFTKPNDAREDERLDRLAKINYGIPLSEKEAAATGRPSLLREQSTQQESGQPSKPMPITPPNEDAK